MSLLSGIHPIPDLSLKENLRFCPHTALTIRRTWLAEVSWWGFLRFIHGSFRVVIVAWLFGYLLGAHLQFRLVPGFPDDFSMSTREADRTAWMDLHRMFCE